MTNAIKKNYHYHEEKKSLEKCLLIFASSRRILPIMGYKKNQSSNFVAMPSTHFYDNLIYHCCFGLVNSTDDLGGSITQTIDEGQKEVALEKALWRHHGPGGLFQNLAVN